MDQTALVITQLQAGEKFLSRFEKCCPSPVAFWLRRGEESTWHLYVSAPEITEDFDKKAGRDAHRIIQELRDPELERSGARILGWNHPAVQAALDFQNRYILTGPARFRGPVFGGIRVEDDVWIYPTKTVSAPA